MTSAINTSYPTAGTASTQSVRDNFLAAKNEISDLQLARVIRVSSVNEATELFQPCAVNNTPQIVQFNQITFINPADLTCLEFDTVNNELIYKESGWYHVDLSAHVIRKTSGGTVDWSIHSQYKEPSGSFANFAAGLRVMTLDGSVSNQRQFFAVSFIAKVNIAGTRFRWMQSCTDGTKNCGLVGNAASGAFPSSAGISWNTHKIGSL